MLNLTQLYIFNPKKLNLVYKYGGFYSDLDQIALKNFQPLTRFSALVNNPTDKIDPESSFFHIKKNHEFLKLAMDDYAKNYDENQWLVFLKISLRRFFLIFNFNIGQQTDLIFYNVL